LANSMARMVSINGYVLGYRFFNPIFEKMLVMTSFLRGAGGINHE